MLYYSETVRLFYVQYLFITNFSILNLRIKHSEKHRKEIIVYKTFL